MAKVKINSDGSITYKCPCGDTHTINNNPNHKWQFNGDVNRPTFRPSVLVRSGHYCDHASKDDCWCNFKERFPDEGEPPFKCYICHSFVTDGKIQFLSDCTHQLAGQTVDMLEEES